MFLCIIYIYILLIYIYYAQFSKHKQTQLIIYFIVLVLSKFICKLCQEQENKLLNIN